ncbi:MAG: FAD:protein FMN transferase [Bacteroidales bacterium]|nr:FAD:protein FMN transferase [Bacteroidales bacterium]
MKRLYLLFVIAIVFASCMRQPQKINYSGITQGSYFSIIYYDEEGRTFEAEIDSIFKEVDNSVSLWNENSIIRKVNRNEDVVVNQIFKDNFEWACKASEFSDGAFDVTIGPLVSAWGFHYKKELEMTPEMVDSIRQLVGYQKIQIVDDKVVKANPNMTLDFNAVAQGYTTDIIGNFLETKGIYNYLVDVGGEIIARGNKPNGELWTIGIEKPTENYDSKRSVQETFTLKDKGIVTSGNYRKYIEKDGVRYSHSIDPKTGYPVEQNLLSATIIADNASWADCLATICMILGKEKASKLLEGQGVEAYFIFVEDGAIHSEWLGH